jgi:hypothetical protein
MAFKASSVIKAIGDPRLTLVAGNGYWYFVFDDVAANMFETHSVSVMRLNQLPLEQWIADGKEFVAKMRQRIEEQNNGAQR